MNERTMLVSKAELADRIAALISLRKQWSPLDRALEIIDTVLDATASTHESDDNLHIQEANKQIVQLRNAFADYVTMTAQLIKDASADAYDKGYRDAKRESEDEVREASDTGYWQGYYDCKEEEEY